MHEQPIDDVKQDGVYRDPGVGGSRYFAEAKSQANRRQGLPAPGLKDPLELRHSGVAGAVHWRCIWYIWYHAHLLFPVHKAVGANSICMSVASLRPRLSGLRTHYSFLIIASNKSWAMVQAGLAMILASTKE
jgi:hypothetical protein